MYDCPLPTLQPPLETICNTNETNQPPSIYVRGTIVYIAIEVGSSENQPKDCQKLWIWEHKWDPNYKNKPNTRSESYGKTLYLLKDGPGEKAKNVCWMSEDKIQEWRAPKVEESLIDLDPGYEEEVKKEQKDLIQCW